MNRVQFIEHKGRTILFLDFSGLMADELPEVVQRARDLIDGCPPKSLLTLSKVDGGRFNGNTVATLKTFVKRNEPFVIRGAVVGLGGLQRLVLDTITKFTGRDFLICKTVEEAKERLVG